MARDPRVGVLMGSDSDLPCMQAAVEVPVEAVAVVDNFGHPVLQGVRAEV